MINNSKQYQIAILIFDGVYLLDFAGPLEVLTDSMLNCAENIFNIFLVSLGEKNIKTNTNTEIIPQYSILNSPIPDILIIPGGNPNLVKNNQELANWILKASKQSIITMSVCTGAFILADLGLLNGKEATTWYGAKERLCKMYPEIKIVDKRFVDNGQIITTAGVSAGIDGALYLVERLIDKETAQNTAQYIEWQ